MGQLVAHITCQCGHVGTITELAKVERLMQGWRPAFRCSGCGAAGQSRLTLGYDAGVNPMETSHRDVGEP